MKVADYEKNEIARRLNDKPVNDAGNCVLYWMQSAVRTTCNYALEFAIAKSSELSCDLYVVFGLTETYPEANARHYTFLIDGLKDVSDAFRASGKAQHFSVGIANANPSDVISRLVGCDRPEDKAKAMKLQPKLVVTDMGYLVHLRAWRTELAEKLPCLLMQCETEATVPVEIVSNKVEYAARTIRPKIHRFLNRFLKLAETLCNGENNLGKINGNALDSTHTSLTQCLEDASIKILDLSRSAREIVADLPVDKSVAATPAFVGGQVQAHKVLETFVNAKLGRYAEDRNDINKRGSSEMSMFLHYGHLSPHECVMAAKKAGSAGASDFIEELVIRRELSFNHTHFNDAYMVLEKAVPEWALKSLKAHEKDKRDPEYSYDELENHRTKDPAWNAAQKQMNETGRMPNYLRMYWAKKILEWSPKIQDAWKNIYTLNNKFFIDGRDSNSWCNFAWIFGAKDRPWSPERPIFGNIRYMNYAGLSRKFDLARYINQSHSSIYTQPREQTERSIDTFFGSTSKGYKEIKAAQKTLEASKRKAKPKQPAAVKAEAIAAGAGKVEPEASSALADGDEEGVSEGEGAGGGKGLDGGPEAGRGATVGRALRRALGKEEDFGKKKRPAKSAELSEEEIGQVGEGIEEVKNKKTNTNKRSKTSKE